MGSKTIYFLFQHPLLRFATIGAIGFMIEAAAVTYFASRPDIGPVYGRLVSFPLAVFVTWWLNRRLTFKSKANPGSESLKYLASQSLSATCNLGLFFVLISCFSDFARQPAIPLFFAALLGLAINFTLAKLWVFKKHER